jgi:hypothetical protein
MGVRAQVFLLCPKEVSYGTHFQAHREDAYRTCIESRSLGVQVACPEYYLVKPLGAEGRIARLRRDRDITSGKACAPEPLAPFDRTRCASLGSRSGPGIAK